MAPTVPPTKPLRIVSDSSLPSTGHAHSRSVSVSFSPLSSPGTPSTPNDPSAIPIRWTKDLEQRLRLAQMSLEEHQRRWSAGQEEYLHEVGPPPPLWAFVPTGSLPTRSKGMNP